MYADLKIVAAAAMTLAQVSNDSVNATSTNARQFLEELATNPNETLTLVTDNALLGFVDIGVPYSTFVKQLSGKTLIPSYCHLIEIKSIGVNDEDVVLPGTHSFVAKDQITKFDSRYDCQRPDGKMYSLAINLEYLRTKVVSVYLSTK